jgi:phenylacetate-CoA ligase
MRDLTSDEMKLLQDRGPVLWKELKKNQFLSRPELEQLKNDRFVAMVRHAYTRVPMYRKKYDAHGVKIDQIKTVADIERLPILEKDDLIEFFPNGALAEGYTVDNVITAISGGSSGKVVRVAYSLDTMIERVMTAFRIYYMMMDGYPPHYEQTYVYTGKYPFESLPDGSYKLNHIWTLDDLETSRRKLMSSSPQMLTLYPSKLADILKGLREEDIAKLRKNLKCINVKSEMSLESQRDEWSRIFGVPVLDEYGSEELAGTVAAQCRHKGYHIWEDINIVEVVDEKDHVIDDGTLGELIATNLYNWAMPIIRYRQGDLISLLERDKPCPCGRTFQMLNEFKGRINSKFIAPSGREFSPGFLLDVGYTRLMKYGEAMATWQLIQETKSDVYFDCQPTPKMTDAIKESLRTEIADLLGHEFNVEVRLVEGVTLTPRGKRNQIISKIEK